MTSATVYIPPPLRPKTGNQAMVTVSGEHIRQVIDELDRAFPGLFFHLCYETGELRPYVNIFLNREDIRRHAGLSTPVPPGSTIYILQSVAGG